MRLDSLQRAKGLDPKLVPPRGSKPTGEVVGEDTIVYEREFTRFEKEPEIDPDTGEQAWERAPSGKRIYRRWVVKPVTETREFILVGHKNGHVSLNFDFREDEASRKARIRREAAQTFSEDLAGIMADEGLSAADLAALLRERKAAQRPDSPHEPEEPDYEAEAVRAGLSPSPDGGWIMPDGEAFAGDAKAALEYLALDAA